jgi:hypothetical protein
MKRVTPQPSPGKIKTVKKKLKRHSSTLILKQNDGNHIVPTTGKARHLFLSIGMDGYVDFILLKNFLISDY